MPSAAFSCVWNVQNANIFYISQGVFTFNRAADDVSPAGIVYGASTCPGETYQPGHSVWPLPEAVYHLFHRELTVYMIVLFFFVWWQLFNKWYVQSCGSTDTKMMGMFNITAKFLATMPICISHAEVEDFLHIFLLWFMEVGALNELAETSTVRTR